MSIAPLFQEEQQERLSKSIRLISIISILFVILVLRLIFLQVIQAKQNIRLSQENGMQFNYIKAPRGLILDRNGVVLARNRPSYFIGILPYKVKNKNREAVMHNLCTIRDTAGVPLFDSTDLAERMQRAWGRRFEVSRLKEDISLDIVSIIEEHAMDLPGITVETEARREYVYGKATFHLLGYMSEVSETQLDSLRKAEGYHYGDMMGKAGIERQYEDILRGKDGEEYIEVNAFGRSLGPISDMPRVEPIPGGNVYLTIDIGLQKIACDSFPDTLKGAVVALDPRNGEVLAMYSSPSVDPNIFSQSVSARTKNWASIALDPSLPLNNRATCGTYPPGSTFKLISAVSGLATGKLNADSHMPAACNGSYRLGGRVAHCWKPSGHGNMNLLDAVKQSCNVYFYQVGLLLGNHIINRYAKLFGLGQPTGVDMPGERSGWLSGEEEYNKRFKHRGWVWTRGLDMDLAIGQAQLTTPIQLANVVAALGNGKFRYTPHLLKEVRNTDDIVLKSGIAPHGVALGLDSSIIGVMHTAMLGVTGEGGTAGRARVPGVPVGGKTGSAQNPQGQKTHALFAGIAPVENPVIAVSAVVENIGHGGTFAAPIAGAVLRHYFTTCPEGKRIVTMYAGTKQDSVE
jgi:penicillin-binding protein 2